VCVCVCVHLMNRVDIASLFWQFLQLNRSAVATIEMIVEVINSMYNCCIGDGIETI